MNKFIVSAAVAAMVLSQPLLASAAPQYGNSRAEQNAPSASESDDAQAKLKSQQKEQRDKLKAQQKDRRDKLKAQQKDERDKLAAELKLQRDKLHADQHAQWQKLRQQASNDDSMQGYAVRPAAAPSRR